MVTSQLNNSPSMTSSVTEHYEKHLAPVYSWMVGDFDAACKTSSEFFDELGLKPTSDACAVDLGCGHGLQTIPLAKRGFDVVAIDSSEILLKELSNRIDQLPITLINDDLLNFTSHLDNSVDLITCMGDTLTHLDSIDSVSNLIRAAAKSLTSEGTLVFSFRDYSSNELRGPDRFIPVRSDDERIHTCFLEYDQHVVFVYDIIQSRSATGWSTSISSYPKLRLAPEDVIRQANASALSLQHQSVRQGMLYLTFQPTQ